MTKIKLSNSEQVDQHIATLSKEIQPAVAYLRQLMLAIDSNIAEHIKWNSPAFYYSGAMKDFDPKEYKRDILVLHLRKNKIMCVLPTGQNIKDNIQLLEGDYTDGRRMINSTNIEDIKQKESLFIGVIKEWISLIDKN